MKLKTRKTRGLLIAAFMLISITALGLSSGSVNATPLMDFCSNCEQSAYEDTWGMSEDSYYNECRETNSVTTCTRLAAQYYNTRIAMCNYAGCEIPYARVPYDN